MYNQSIVRMFMALYTKPLLRQKDDFYLKRIKMHTVSIKEVGAGAVAVVKLPPMTALADEFELLFLFATSKGVTNELFSFISSLLCIVDWQSCFTSFSFSFSVHGFGCRI